MLSGYEHEVRKDVLLKGDCIVVLSDFLQCEMIRFLLFTRKASLELEFCCSSIKGDEVVKFALIDDLVPWRWMNFRDCVFRRPINLMVLLVVVTSPKKWSYSFVSLLGAHPKMLSKKAAIKSFFIIGTFKCFASNH